MVLIAGSIDPNAPPNLAPEWTSQPTPSFVALTAGTYNFQNNVFDPEDTVTFALNAGSSALPSGFSLASNGVLTADGTQTTGSTTGIIVDADDGVNAAVASSAFSIAVVTQSNTNPTLWQDFGGNDFAGEAGAVAVNDNAASTVYQYIPQYEPTIPTLPTPTTGTAFSGSSEVNPNAADEYLVRAADASTGWAAAANSSTYKKIFIEKGSDLHLAGNTTITVTATSGAPRWIIWWDPDTPSNVDDIKPWDLAEADKVYMPRLDFTGGTYHYLVGLKWGKDGDFETACMRQSTAASDITMYRCQKEYTDASIGILCFQDAGDNFTVYQCYFNDSTPQGQEASEILIQGGTGVRIISNECKDYQNNFVQFGNQWGEDDAVVEDNDVYKVKRYDGSGNLDPTGDYTQGEGGIGIKLANTSSDASNTAIKIYGNRFHSFRLLDPVNDPSDNTGSCIQFSEDTRKRRIDIRWNIFSECSNNCIRMSSGPTATGSGYHSIVRNIVHDFRVQFYNSSNARNSPFYTPHDNCEFYLNTVYNATGVDALTAFFRVDAGVSNQDWLGNFFADTEDWLSQSKLLSGNQFGYNAYAGSYTILNATYGNDYEAASKAALNMSDFKYRRKRLTGEVTETLEGIVPTTSTPAGFTGAVPVKPASNSPGSRASIGVDDVS